MKRTTPRSRRRTAIGFAAILTGMLLSMVGLGADLVDASTRVPNPVPYNGNLDCDDLGFAYEFKIDKQPTNGVYTVGSPGVATSGAVPAGMTITISNVELVNGRMEFDWASNQALGAVLVKQSNEGLRYDYNPAASDDQNVQTVTGANQGGISHVSFCGPGVPAPPAPTYQCSAATNVTQTTATLNGATTDAAVTSAVFTLNPGGIVLNDNDGAPFTVNATGLTANTAYTYTVTFNPGAHQQSNAACGFTTLAAGGPGPVIVNPPVVTPPVTPPVVEPPVVEPPVVEPPVVEPEVITPPVVTPPVVPPTEVAGVVIPRQLPRTGSMTLPLLQIGLGMILLGAGVMLFGRERTALI